MNFKNYFLIALMALGIASCETSEVEVDLDNSSLESSAKRSMQKTIDVYVDTNDSDLSKGKSSALDWMVSVNEAFKTNGVSLQLSTIEYYTSDGQGNEVFFNDRGNKQVSADFVPNDPRRGGFTNIAYGRDGVENTTSSGLSKEETDQAILNAMKTWDEVTCSKGLILENLGASPFDLGYVQALVTNGAEGSFFFTDVMHSGFNTTVTDAIFGPGSNVLGVAFTFNFINLEDGSPTDIDNNGKDDVAFRDIYYNDRYAWSTDGSGVDTETVVLHEAGHGLSQAHFGKLFRTEKNEKFHFAPRAVMNAGYTGIQRTIGKSDKAGHCSNWAEWPKN